MVLAVCQISWDLLKGVGIGKVSLVSEGRNGALLYTLGPSGPFQEERDHRPDQVSC